MALRPCCCKKEEEEEDEDGVMMTMTVVYDVKDTDANESK